MKIGVRVSWTAVNGIVSGVLEQSRPGGDWVVRLDNGKIVIVNEKSFIKDV